MRETTSSRNDGGGKNSVIYMGLISGPNKADDTCGITGTMERGFTVFGIFNVYMSKMEIGLNRNLSAMQTFSSRNSIQTRIM